MNSEETQSETTFELLTWLEVNKKRLVIVAAAVLALGLAVYVYNYYRDGKENDATAALLDLRKISDGTRPLPTSSADFFKMAENFPGTRAAERATLEGAAALFTEGKFADAKAKFEQFISANPGSTYLPTAEFGVAASLDGMNQLDQALTAYQQIVSRYSGEAVAAQARLAMGIIYEARKQPDLALKAYTDAASAKDEMFWRQDVSMLRGHLLLEHPELVEKPATPVMPVPPALAPNASATPSAPPPMVLTNAAGAKAPAKTPAPAPVVPKK